MNVAQETLGFRRAGLSPALSLLMSAFALPIAPADLSIHLHSLRERSSTTASDSSISLHTTPKQHGRATRGRATPAMSNTLGGTILSESLAIRSFGARLEPRYIFGAGRLIDQ